MDALRFISPAVLMQNAMNDVAGTGAARHQAFLSQVDAFHQAWRRHFTPLVMARTAVLDYQQLPRFVFVEESLAAVAGRVTLSVLGLLLPTVVTGWIARRRD